MKLKQLPALLLIIPLTAIAGEKHVHGEAQLMIAIEGHQIQIALDSPGDNIMGFEHAPNTEEQKMLLNDNLKLLANYNTLISFAAGNCKQIDANIDSPFKHSDEHHDSVSKDKQDDDKNHDHHEGHVDFEPSYTLECETPGTIENAKITAFEYFKGFEKIQVNWVTTSGQGSQTATAKKPVVNIKQ